MGRLDCVMMAPRRERYLTARSLSEEVSWVFVLGFRGLTDELDGKVKV